MHEIFQLSKTQRRCMRSILSQIRQETDTGQSTNRYRRDLRMTVTRQLLDQVGSQAILATHKPAPKSKSQAEPSFCRICDRYTRHRDDQCQEHEVKYCDACRAMTARTPNGKCTKHVNRHCYDCRETRDFVGGVCTHAASHKWF